jgi:type II secretory pathway pseudopilin PulG
MSTAAVVAVAVGVVALVGLVFLGIVAAIAVPSFMRARAAANEAAAIGALRRVANAEDRFRETHDRFGRLVELAGDGLVPPDVKDGGTQNGYRYREAAVSADAFDIALDAGSESGAERSFNVTEDYVIRYAAGPRAPTGKSGTVLGMD